MRVEIAPSAARDLRRLPVGVRQRLAVAILSLGDQPRPPGVRKIRGAERAFRIRVARYRVIYDVYDHEQLVVILAVGPRNEGTYRGY